MMVRHVDLGPAIAAMLVKQGDAEVLCINVGLTPAECAEAAWRLGQEVPADVCAESRSAV